MAWVYSRQELIGKHRSDLDVGLDHECPSGRTFHLQQCPVPYRSPAPPHPGGSESASISTLPPFSGRKPDEMSANGARALRSGSSNRGETLLRHALNR